jgi:hypothetical protein
MASLKARLLQANIWRFSISLPSTFCLASLLVMLLEILEIAASSLPLYLTPVSSALGGSARRPQRRT